MRGGVGHLGDAAVSSGSEVRNGPHDVPSTVELLDAVREFLERDVMANTEGRVAFHARVAANVVAMVAP